MTFNDYCAAMLPTLVQFLLVLFQKLAPVVCMDIYRAHLAPIGKPLLAAGGAYWDGAPGLLCGILLGLAVLCVVLKTHWRSGPRDFSTPMRKGQKYDATPTLEQVRVLLEFHKFWQDEKEHARQCDKVLSHPSIKTNTLYTFYILRSKYQSLLPKIYEQFKADDSLTWSGRLHERERRRGAVSVGLAKQRESRESHCMY